MPIIRVSIVIVLLAYAGLGMADSTVIDKVYHPYVQPLERELEWRFVAQEGEQKHRFAFGYSLSDRVYVETYLLASSANNRIDDVEVELLWQLTEQGEYAADWAVLFELEKDLDENNWEWISSLIAERQWGKWVGTANAKVIYEWGETVQSEIESALAMQLRYRYSPAIEPAIEFYAGKEAYAIGPVVLGDVRLGAGKKLHWESGVVFAIDNRSPDTTLRFLTEYEF